MAAYGLSPSTRIWLRVLALFIVYTQADYCKNCLYAGNS